MPKKLLSILMFALSLLVNTIKTVNYKEFYDDYEEYYNNAQGKRYEAQSNQHYAEKNLLSTPKGQEYEEAKNNYLACRRERKQNDLWYECENDKQKLKNALKTLQETIEYEEFLPIRGEAVYYEFLEDGLLKILENLKEPIDKNWSQKKRIRFLHKIIDNETINAELKPGASGNDMFIRSSKDISEDIEKAREELRRIVNVVENPELLYPIPQYD